jgi:hypothetical protein
MTTPVKKIIVRYSSYNIWWGHYDLCEKQGWEDLVLMNENKEPFAWPCLCTRDYLKGGLEIDLFEDEEEDPYEPDEVDLMYKADVERYMADNTIHYWYLYKEKDDPSFGEVEHEAPRNDQGFKPSYIEIWHPDDGIDVSTIISAVTDYAKVHLGEADYIVELEDFVPFEEALASFQDRVDLSTVEMNYSDGLIEQLSELWNLSKEQALARIKKIVENNG